jgi:hypothetical protein
MKLNAVTGKEADTIKTLEQLMLRNDVLRDKAILKEQQLYDLKVKQALLQDQITRNSLGNQIDNLNLSLDPVTKLLGGTQGGQVFLQVQQQRLDLSNQILSTESQINALNNERIYAQTPAEKASLSSTIEMYQRLHDASIMALDQLSAEGVATEQFWAGVGETIFSNTSSAIQGLIEGTMTWRDVMSRVFSELTELAIEYIGKLIFIKAMEAASGIATGGGMGGSPSPTGVGGPMFAFANGAALKGSVKPFANRDIIAGPTMFGLAGEAGNEAIMPLERIGGKLGVNAAGMGGDSYHFTIQAIDTQSGTEFLMRNMDSIVGGVRQRGRLNHGVGRSL